DSLVAAFRSGRAAQPAAKAMDAARMLLAEFEPVGERWKTDFGFPAAAAVGLHAGDTVFGMAGPAGGEQYVASGDTVSIAERLVHRARAGEIVFSAAVAKALGASALADWGAETLPALELARRPALPIFGLLLETRLDFPETARERRARGRGPSTGRPSGRSRRAPSRASSRPCRTGATQCGSRA